MAPTIPGSLMHNASKLKNYFTCYPDFPKKGILFWDVFALYKNPEAFKLLNSALNDYAQIMKGEADTVVGIEARGFLLGPSLAQMINGSFVPIRKKGKLPGEVIQKTYELEYGVDIVEIQADSIKPGQKVIIVDDCIATGGTLNATCDLIRELGAVVVDCLVIYTIPDLNGIQNISAPITSLCS